MKLIPALLPLALSLGAAAPATTAAPLEPVEEYDLPVLGNLEQVDSIPAMTRLHSFRVVDDDTLIVFSSPSRPYLVELFRPSPELKFASAIGVTSFGSRIHARFDSVEIRGFSYPIREIYKLSRDDAKAFTAPYLAGDVE